MSDLLMPNLTTDGIAMINRSIASNERITFTKIQLGTGQQDKDISEITNLVSPCLDVPLILTEVSKEYVLITGRSSSAHIEQSFYATELGIWAKGEDDIEKLYAYSYTEDDADYYTSSDSNRIIEFDITVVASISNAPNVTAILVEGDAYATKEAFLSHVNDRNNPHKVTKSQIGLSNVPNVTTNNQTPTFSYTSALENINSGEALSIILGKIRAAIVGLFAHLNNRNNPHFVTKEEVGLGNVENKVIGNQTPTFAEATSYETINSGETLSVIFGKIKRLFTQFNSHILIFTNESVNVDDWNEEADEKLPKYYADILLEGVTENHMPYVCFSLSDSISGNFAGCCESKNGYVRIWAEKLPEDSVTISNITCIQGGAS